MQFKKKKKKPKSSAINEELAKEQEELFKSAQSIMLAESMSTATPVAAIPSSALPQLQPSLSLQKTAEISIPTSLSTIPLKIEKLASEGPKSLSEDMVKKLDKRLSEKQENAVEGTDFDALGDKP